MSGLLHNRLLSKLKDSIEKAGFSSRAVGISVALHLLLLVIAILLNSDNRIYKPFMVRGIYSRNVLPVKWTLPKLPGGGSSLRGGQKKGSTAGTVAQKGKGAPAKATKKTAKKQVKAKTKKESRKPDGTHLTDEQKGQPVKKIKKKRKALVNKKTPQKPIEQKPVEPEPIEEPMIEQEKIEEPVQALESTPESVIDDVAEVSGEAAGDDDMPNVMHYDFTGHVDHGMMVLQLEVQEEIERVWQPPVGVPQGTIVKARLTISPQGAVTDVEIIETSPIQIYDMSVIRDAHRFTFSHKGLWGKTIDVTFRQ